MLRLVLCLDEYNARIYLQKICIRAVLHMEKSNKNYKKD